MASQSKIDFNQFRCTLCNKYLSVPPVYMYTEQSKQGQNICGRCKVPKENRVCRNVAFEAMAQYLEFPCINSKTCSNKLRWGEVERHEDECGLKTVQCDICLDLHPITKIVPHFEQKHREKLFYDSVLVTTEEDIGKPKSTNQFLMVTSKDPYLISTDANRILLTSNVILTIKVTPLFESSKLRTFTATFSDENHTVVFKNKAIKRHDNVDDWVSHIFNLTTLKLLLLPDETDLKIELKIDQVTKNTTITKKTKPNQVSDMEKTSTLFEKLVDDLGCPICTAIMSTNIVVCRRGHSICEKCKNSCCTVCPICRSPFAVNRNFALEDVCKKLKDFVI